MGKTTPRAPAAQPKKRSAPAVGAATILTFVVLLYFIELLDQMTEIGRAHV